MIQISRAAHKEMFVAGLANLFQSKGSSLFRATFWGPHAVAGRTRDKVGGATNEAGPLRGVAYGERVWLAGKGCGDSAEGQIERSGGPHLPRTPGKKRETEVPYP